jgi:hypothetical protein
VTDGKTRVVRIYDAPLLPKASGWQCPDRDISHLAGRSESEPAVDQPFALPAFLDAQFAALRGYWNSLKRGNASNPFADDLSLAALGKLADSIVLIQVFEKPQRFRFEMAAANVARLYRGELEGRFADELDIRAPLQYFAAQCSATAESGAPTFYRCEQRADSAEYKRLMLPFWGDGHVSTILVAFETRQNG